MSYVGPPRLPTRESKGFPEQTTDEEGVWHDTVNGPVWVPGPDTRIPERANREGDTQNLPNPNDEKDIQARVIEDIIARRVIGIQRYGTALQPFNGRDALLDAYEEALDLTMYLKQALVERDRPHQCSVCDDEQSPAHCQTARAYRQMLSDAGVSDGVLKAVERSVTK